MAGRSAKPRPPTLGHIHIGVRRLPEAVRWMRDVLGLEPSFRMPTMATFPLGGASVIFDRAEADAPLTIALASDDCVRDFRAYVERGARILAEPEDLPYGVRAAYVRGPGKVTVEIEQWLG